MPNRYLRESFIESERVNAVSLTAELFWLHLLVNVDDFGRCEANPELLRARLFPLRLETIRKATVSGWIAECELAQLVRRYEVDGKQYLQMERWEKGRAEKSKYPPPPTAVNKCLQPHTNAPDPDPDYDTDNKRESMGWRNSIGECVRACGMAGIPREFIETIWREHDATGVWKDWQNREITRIGSYIKSRYDKSESRKTERNHGQRSNTGRSGNEAPGTRSKSTEVESGQISLRRLNDPVAVD